MLEKIYRDILFLVCLSLSAEAFADDIVQQNLSFRRKDYGLIAPGNQSPTSLFHLSNEAMFSNPLDPGQNYFGISTAISNTLNWRPDQYNVDMETVVSRFSFGRGFGEDWSVFANISQISLSSGFSDKLIRKWHSMFGLPQGRRNTVADDEFSFTAGDSETSDQSLGKQETALGQASVCGLYRLLPEQELLPQSVLQIAVGSPPPVGLEGNSGFDFLLGLLLHKEIFYFNLDLGASITHYGDTRIGNLLFEEQVFSVFGYLSLPVSDSWDLTLGIPFISPQISGIIDPATSQRVSANNLDEAASYLDFGASLSTEIGRLRFLIREDGLQNGRSTDITFYLGWSLTSDG